jgi:hypothetical protein
MMALCAHFVIAMVDRPAEQELKRTLRAPEDANRQDIQVQTLPVEKE